MPVFPLRHPSSVIRPESRRRLAFILVLSIVLHWLLIGVATNGLRLFEPKQEDKAVLQAALVPTPQLAPPPPAAPKRQPQQPKSKPVPTAKPAPQAPIEPSVAAASAPIMPVEMPIPVPSDTPEEIAQAEGDPAQRARKSHATALGQRLRISPPPSARLHYDVEGTKNGDAVYGKGKIEWDFSGARYSVRGEAGVLFITVLSFGSEGGADEFGIAPVIYTEERFRKAATATHFNRERNLISFSASTHSYPLVGGEQDRASVVWQLAGIGRGDTEKFVPNAVFPIFVAGARDGEQWDMQVVGEEEIDTGLGRVPTWHVVRIPRPGSYEQKLDIWFAPRESWYPVRIRFTERNGDSLTMTTSSIDKGN
jgi:hypothetical protein